MKQSLIKIAKAHPETRKHLIPLLRGASVLIHIDFPSMLAEAMIDANKGFNHGITRALTALAPEVSALDFQLQMDNFSSFFESTRSSQVVSLTIVVKDVIKGSLRTLDEVTDIFTEVLGVSPIVRVHGRNIWFVTVRVSMPPSH